MPTVTYTINFTNMPAVGFAKWAADWHSINSTN